MMSTDIGTSLGVTVGGVSVGTSGSYGWGNGYSLSVGQAALFAGSSPSLPDAPNTPEDEYKEYGFKFTPWVYLQEWTLPNGTSGKFFVQTYSVEY